VFYQLLAKKPNETVGASSSLTTETTVFWKKAKQLADLKQVYSHQ